MREAIEARVTQAIAEKVFPGCVIGTVQASGERNVFAFDNLTYEQGEPVHEGTLYDLASITKSIPTASLAAKLIEDGVLSLETRLVDLVPAFTAPGGALLTIRHLLTYTVPCYPLSAYKHLSAMSLANEIFSHEVGVAGSAFSYANLPAYLLGLAVEAVTKMPVDILAKREFFDPLGMTNTTFAPRLGRELSEIAPSEIVDGVELRGVVHDESARIFAGAGKAVGHAGLFSTVSDLLTFLEMLLCGGIHNGRQYFSESTIQSFETNQIPELNKEASLGWELHQPWMGERAGPATFGKTGFTGTCAVVDRERQIAFVILSNRTYPKRPSSTESMNTFRCAVANVLL